MVGSGAAGYAAANRLYEAGQRDIVMLTEGVNKGTSRNTGSDKQTYYKLSLCGGTADSVEEMARTYFAGRGVDGDLALCEAAFSPRCFYYLCEAGVPFPHNAFGEYSGYKTDHDPAMRATSAGPLTSKYMTECLERRARDHGITVYDNWLVISILVKESQCVGLMALNRQSGEYLLVNAANVVYASGGPAGVYKNSVYPSSQSGATGIALEAGAAAKNLAEWQYGIASLKFRWNLSGTYQQVLPRYVSTDSEGKDEREFLEGQFDSPESLLTAVFLKGYQWPFDPAKVKNQGSSMIDMLVYRETVEKKRRVFLDYRRNPESLNRLGTDWLTRLGDPAASYLAQSGATQDTPIGRLLHMNPRAVELGAEALKPLSSLNLSKHQLNEVGDRRFGDRSHPVRGAGGKLGSHPHKRRWFMVLIRHGSEEILNKICAAIEQRVQRYNAAAPAGSFQLSFSTGVAKYEGGSVEKFLAELDERMYAGKARFPRRPERPCRTGAGGTLHQFQNNVLKKE